MQIKLNFVSPKVSSGFMNYFNMNGFTIEPADSLKHLGVLWNVKKNTLTMDDENVSGRLTKFWSVIKTLVKDGIRFCHPSTIRQLFISLAIPTLTYGLELCDLSVGFLQKLDTEGRKALKSLFNISSYSRNYLEQLLNIEKISTRLIKNKLGLLVRLLNTDKTSEILMKMFQQHSHKGSFSFDLQDIASRLELDLAGIIVTKNYPSIQSEHIRDIDQVVQDRLTHCLNNWHEAGSRAYFINFMEERVVRLDWAGAGVRCRFRLSVLAGFRCLPTGYQLVSQSYLVSPPILFFTHICGFLSIELHKEPLFPEMCEVVWDDNFLSFVGGLWGDALVSPLRTHKL